jgi:hypothetical protein
MNIVEAIGHEHLFGPFFTNPSWRPWFSVLRTMFGLPLDDDDRALFNQCTGRSTAPNAPFKENWLCIGRRGGKSFIMALIAVYLSCFFDYGTFLNVGERGTIMLIAADRKQARVVLRYIRGLLSLPALRDMVERETAESFDLTNRITIEIHTASFQTVRGYTVCAAICDECAFWNSDENSAAPDVEIIRALRPAMALIPNSMMICASSPYARKGALWKAFEKHYGRDDSNVLFWRAPTRTMNPMFPQAEIDSLMDEDPQACASEYLAEFRDDIASFIDRDSVLACVRPGLYEIPYIFRENYSAFADPSGGRNDSFTFAIASSHYEGDVRIARLCLLREYSAPCDPSVVIDDICKICREYKIFAVMGDRYGGEFPPERFRSHGVTYQISEKTKSEIYRDALPLLNSGRVELLDDKKLIAQICSLERRVGRGTGRDIIDHRPGGHDDVCNAALGALMQASNLSGGFCLQSYIRAFS